MKVVVIGAQGAAMSCVARLKRNLKDCNIKVFDKVNYVSFGACGLPYFVADFFQDSNHLFAKQPSDFKNLGIDLSLETEVLKVDHLKQLVYVKNLITNESYSESYDKLVIASGSSAKELSTEYFLENDNNKLKDKIVNLKTLDDAKYIKDNIQNGKIKSIAIVGAGYIGLELLELKQQYPNLDITLIDNKEKLCDNLIDGDFEDIIYQEIQSHNIAIKLNSTLKTIQLSDNSINLKLINNSQQEEENITVDLVITAIGFIPSCNFVQELPLQKLDNGAIRINNKGETNIANIYACGDATAVYHSILKQHKYIPLATIANKMGRVVGDNIAGKTAVMSDIIGSASLRLLNLEIAKTGITEFEAIRDNIAYKTVFVKDYNQTNYYHNQQEIFAKIILSDDKSKIIGATIVGKNGAALRAHALTVAIMAKIPPQELAMMDFGYSPTFTRTWEFLNIIGNVATKA